ncbi:hypothetical protein D3C80_2114500 [compost metagenome]
MDLGGVGGGPAQLEGLDPAGFPGLEGVAHFVVQGADIVGAAGAVAEDGDQALVVERGAEGAGLLARTVR